MALISFGIHLLLYKRITVTTGSLRQYYLCQIRTIPWQEARFFAVDGPTGYYELASATTIIRWNPTFLRTTSATDDELAALNAYITAQTGLPLFDLKQV